MESKRIAILIDRSGSMKEYRKNLVVQEAVKSLVLKLKKQEMQFSWRNVKVSFSNIGLFEPVQLLAIDEALAYANNRNNFSILEATQYKLKPKDQLKKISDVIASDNSDTAFIWFTDGWLPRDWVGNLNSLEDYLKKSGYLSACCQVGDDAKTDTLHKLLSDREHCFFPWDITRVLDAI